MKDRFSFLLFIFLFGVLSGILINMTFRGNTLIGIEPNTGQPGYQISYRTWYGTTEYFYPVTTRVKNRFLKIMMMKEY
jgi:hypothetical protein